MSMIINLKTLCVCIHHWYGKKCMTYSNSLIGHLYKKFIGFDLSFYTFEHLVNPNLVGQCCNNMVINNKIVIGVTCMDLTISARRCYEPFWPFQHCVTKVRVVTFPSNLDHPCRCAKKGSWSHQISSNLYVWLMF